MNELLSVQRIAELGNAMYEWILSNVFVVGNAVQLGIIAAAFGVAVFAERRLMPILVRMSTHPTAAKLVREAEPLVLPLIWLVILWSSISIATAAVWPHNLLDVAAILITAWIVIRLVSQLVRNPVWAKVVAWTAWAIAALSILNLLDPIVTALDSAAITFGQFRISVYTILQSTVALAFLLWIVSYVMGLLEARIRTSRALSPSVQVLFVKSLKIVLISLAFLIVIRNIGIDLTALAVIGGALGVGIGFGLQKVVSNLISGVILLLDRSIKPGDVIAVEGTYGWVTALGGRYVSVVTRDGVEHLIPNETLISERVENWTHSNSQTRLKIPIRVHYDSDVKKAMELCTEAATETDRVLANQEAKCLLIGFGENCVDMEVRLWIADAQNGVNNVKSAVLLKIWDKFKEHGIRIPYPQRDVHIKTSPEKPVQGVQRTVA